MPPRCRSTVRSVWTLSSLPDIIGESASSPVDSKSPPLGGNSYKTVPDTVSRGDNGVVHILMPILIY